MAYKEQKTEGKLTDAEVQARLTPHLIKALQAWAVKELIPTLRVLSKAPNQAVFIPKTTDKILELLKKAPHGLSARQIHYELDASQETIATILKKLYRLNRVTRVRISHSYVYQINPRS